MATIDELERRVDKLLASLDAEKEVERLREENEQLEQKLGLKTKEEQERILESDRKRKGVDYRGVLQGLADRRLLLKGRPDAQEQVKDYLEMTKIVMTGREEKCLIEFLEVIESKVAFYGNGTYTAFAYSIEETLLFYCGILNKKNENERHYEQTRLDEPNAILNKQEENKRLYKKIDLKLFPPSTAKEDTAKKLMKASLAVVVGGALIAGISYLAATVPVRSVDGIMVPSGEKVMLRYNIFNQRLLDE